MENDLKYTVRSREIVDLVAAMRTGRLTLSAYFQRNLVWRETHRRDFIDTILVGLPFPQIFLARGPINLDTMEASQCVVDGQQRLSAIRDFASNKLTFDRKVFTDFSNRAREVFLKYEVAVIDFDLDAGDLRLKHVFRRLNRTYYSLSAIERLASEYSASEFLLVARVLCGEISNEDPDPEGLELAAEDEAPGGGATLFNNVFGKDPGIDDSTWRWLLSVADGSYAKILKGDQIFSKLEFDRKIPLMFTLNLMCTNLVGYYNRNDKVREFLDSRADVFAERESIIKEIDKSSDFILAMQLPSKSIWWSKANFFSLVAELSRHPNVQLNEPSEVASKLMRLASDLPPDFALAAREGVGRKAQRELRGKAIRAALQDGSLS